MSHKWSLLGVGRFYTAEEALTLLMNTSDFEDESTSESENEGDSSDSSEYLNNSIRSELIQIFKQYCLKKQLIRIPQSMLYWLMKQPPHQVRNMLLHLQKYLNPKKYPKRAKKLHQKLVVNQNATKRALLADETATASGEEHVASPPKVSKAKEIPKKSQKAAPKLVVNQNATKRALLADETATASGEEHVASPPNVSKAKEIPEKGQKAESKLVVNQSATKAMASDSDMDVEDYYIVEDAN